MKIEINIDERNVYGKRVAKMKSLLVRAMVEDLGGIAQETNRPLEAIDAMELKVDGKKIDILKSRKVIYYE